MAARASTNPGPSGSPPAIAGAATTFVHTVGRFETRPSLSSVASGTALEVVAALIPKFLQHESELAGDVVGLRAGLELLRQYVPGVGLDLDMRREMLRIQRRQSGQKRVLRRGELAEIGEEHRHVAMDAPFAGRAALAERREGIRQVGEALELAV